MGQRHRVGLSIEQNVDHVADHDDDRISQRAHDRQKGERQRAEADADERALGGGQVGANLADDGDEDASAGLEDGCDSG